MQTFFNHLEGKEQYLKNTQNAEIYRVIYILGAATDSVARGLAWPARRFTGRQTAAARIHSLYFSVTLIPATL